jgi:flagellar hook-basal body complex protein FliE
VRVELLQPDVAPPGTDSTPAGSGFAQALDWVARALVDATRAEDAYANGNGSLQDAEYRRAQADVTLAVATAAVQRSAQAIQTLLNVQI